MKKTSKRVLSVLLSVIMVLSVIPFTGIIAFAASSKDASKVCSDLSFWTPEAIYLYPDGSSWTASTSTPFQYFINNNRDGSVKTAYDETGYIYFTYPNASATSLSARFIDSSFNTISGGSVNISNTSPSSGIDVTFNGTSPLLAASSKGCWIEWTLSFTDTTDGKTKKAYSYTYVYKPYVVPVGGFVKLCNSRYNDSFAQSITWISGVHSITVGTLHDNGGYYPNYSGGKGFSAFITKGTKGYYGSTSYTAGKSTALINSSSWSGCYEGAATWNLAFMNGNSSGGPYFQTSASNTGATGWGTTSSTGGFNVRSMDYWYKEKDAENILVNLTSGASGNITIDSSRYSNLKDIPNLAGGLMVTDDEASDEGGHWLVADASGITSGRDCDYWTGSGTVSNYLGYKNYAIARQGANSRTDWGNSGPSGSWEEEGVKYAGPWPRTLLGSPNSQGGTYKYTWMGWYGNNDDGTDFSFNRCTVDLNATYRNKANLRAAVERTIKKMPALGFNGISSGTVSSCYFDANTTYKWTSLQSAYKAAVLALGQLDTTQNCDTLASNLNAALNALCTKVTLSANGGSMSGTSSQYVTVNTNQTVSVTPKNWSGYTAPTRTGYSFEGWSASSSASSGSDTITVGYNNTLYAVWKANTINVTYNGNGATSSVLPQNSKFTYGTAFNTAAQLDRKYTVTYDYNGATGGTGTSSSVSSYTWKGWKSSANGAVYNASTTYTDNFGATGGTLTFTAQWESASVILPSPVKTGYTFNGWYTSSSGGTKAGNAGAPYTPSSNITLYAQWTINQYTLDLNGTLDNMSRDNISGIATADVYVNGTLQADDCRDYTSQFDYGTAYTVKDIKTAAGYTYDGAETISGTVESGGSTVVLRFHTNTYNILYNGNGSTGGSTASQNGIKFGADCQLNANGFTRDGYDFAGWATSQNGDVLYGNNAVVNTLTTADRASVTLYAKWTPRTDRSYKVNVYLMNTSGTYPASPESFIFGNQTTGTNVSVLYESYIPEGKDASQFYLDTSKSNVTSGTVLGNNGLTLVMYIARRSHTVTYDYTTHGGTYASESTVKVYYDADISLTPAAQKTGWIFKGWYTAAHEQTGAVISALKMGANDVTLYAVFSCTMKIRCYYIDPMKTNARTYQETSATVYNDASSVTIPTYDGMPEFTTNFNDTYSAFRGYTTGASYTGSEILIGAGSGATFTSDAGFENNKLMATYSGCYDMTVELIHDAQGGVPSGDNPTGIAYLMATSSRFAYTTIKIPTLSAPTREGYTFLAWAKTPDSEQSKYIEEGKDVSLYYNTTVYAIWLRSWDGNDEANRLEAEMNTDIVTGVKINADGTKSAVTNGTIYKYTNYTELARLYNAYASALNGYNSNTGSFKLIYAKQLETSLNELRAYYSANLNESNLSAANAEYLNSFTVSYATGMTKIGNISSGRHSLADMNLNFYTEETLSQLLALKTEADSLDFSGAKAFDSIGGQPAQQKINSLTEQMSKLFASAEKNGSEAVLTVQDNANYAEIGSDGTYYIYTNSKTPEIVIKADEIGECVSYPTTAAVSGKNYEISSEQVSNSTYDAYLACGMGTAPGAEYYGTKAVVTLKPVFTSDRQTQTYTVSAYDDELCTGDSDRNYASGVSLSGANDTSYAAAGQQVRIVVSYKSGTGFGVTGNTADSGETLPDRYSLSLSGVDSSELAVYRDDFYLENDPQYGRTYYGSFVYLFKAGESDSVENCTVKSADIEDVHSFFENSDNFDAAYEKGYESAPEGSGLGLIPWSRSDGNTLEFYPADDAYVYIHVTDKWGNSVDRVVQAGRFSYNEINESFEFVNGVSVTEQGGVKYVGGFRKQMTEAQLSRYFEYENVEVECEASSNRFGTGSTITVTYSNGDTETYVIIIYGDVNGDAKIDSEDASLLEATLNLTEDPLTGAYKLAANISGSNAKVNDSDLSALADVAASILEIDQETGKIVE